VGVAWFEIELVLSVGVVVVIVLSVGVVVVIVSGLLEFVQRVVAMLVLMGWSALAVALRFDLSIQCSSAARCTLNQMWR
jgi:hypothetical protein